jgi:hypothetical protein
VTWTDGQTNGQRDKVIAINRYISFYWKKWFYIWYMDLAWWLVPCLPFPGLPHIYFLFTARLRIFPVTDKRTDRETRWLQYSPLSMSGGIINLCLMRRKQIYVRNFPNCEQFMLSIHVQHFLPKLVSKNVLIRLDNSTVVRCINKQGGTHSPQLCMRQIPWKVSFLLRWPPYPLLEASVVRVIDVFHGVMDLLLFRFSWFNHHFRWLREDAQSSNKYRFHSKFGKVKFNPNTDNNLHRSNVLFKRGNSSSYDLLQTNRLGKQLDGCLELSRVQLSLSTLLWKFGELPLARNKELCVRYGFDNVYGWEIISFDLVYGFQIL